MTKRTVPSGPEAQAAAAAAKVVGSDDVRAAQNRTARLRTEVADGSVLDHLDDTQPTAELVKATSNGRSHQDIALGDYIQLVRHAERQVFDASTGQKLQVELDSARRQMQMRAHVDEATRRAIKALADEWAAPYDGEDGGL